MSSPTKVLVVSPEPVAERMAGPAIRALELARSLASNTEVTLAAPPPSAFGDLPCDTREIGVRETPALRRAALAHDVVIAPQLPARQRRELARHAPRLVIDLHAPLHLESLERLKDAGDRRRATADWLTRDLVSNLLAADYLICANERQRDLWLGALVAAGGIDAEAYDRDPTYRSVIDVVPSGIGDQPPVRGAAVMRNVWSGIGPEDRLVVWGGGVWSWLDAVTAIDAVERLSRSRPDVRLVFPGVVRPGASGAGGEREAADRALAHARTRGLEGRSVFFNEGWVPYAERGSFLLEGDVGVSTHLDTLESRFAARTRILDYLWAGLPVACTRGDGLADLVEERGLGTTVPPGDPEALAAAIAGLLDREAGERARANVAAIAPALRWSEVTRPLVDYCLSPIRRPGRASPRPRLRSAREAPAFARFLLREHGPRRFAATAAKRLIGRDVSWDE